MVKISLGILAASLVVAAAPSFAQSTAPPGAATPSTRQERGAGSVTTSDQDLNRGAGGASTGTGTPAPDPTVGNNTSKGTDARGTVSPPPRDADANDALKKKD